MGSQKVEKARSGKLCSYYESYNDSSYDNLIYPVTCLPGDCLSQGSSKHSSYIQVPSHFSASESFGKLESREIFAYSLIWPCSLPILSKIWIEFWSTQAQPAGPWMDCYQSRVWYFWIISLRLTIATRFHHHTSHLSYFFLLCRSSKHGTKQKKGRRPVQLIPI